MNPATRAVAAMNLAKIISNGRHPAPCMNATACRSLAVHVVDAFMQLDPALVQRLGMHPLVDVSIFDK